MKFKLIAFFAVSTILMTSCGYSFETDDTLDAYLDVVARMERSNHALQESAISRMPQMEVRFKKMPDYLPLSKAAKEVLKITEEFTTYLDNISKEFYQFAQKGDDRFIGYFQTLDKNTLRNKRLVNDFFINGYKDINGNWNEPEGVNINAKISETNRQFIAILHELSEKKVFRMPESEKKEVIARFLLGTPENHASQSDTKEDIFRDKSVAATYANMTMLKNDALLTAQMIINYFGAKISDPSVIFDKYYVVSSPHKTYIKSGETYKADVFLSAASSEAEVTAKINGKTYPVEDGVILYEAKPNRKGTHTYEAEITIKNPNSQRTETYKKTFKYEVGECYN